MELHIPHIKGWDTLIEIILIQTFIENLSEVLTVTVFLQYYC